MGGLIKICENYKERRLGQSSLKKALKSAGSWVEGAAKTVGNAAKSVYNGGVKPVANTLYNDGKSVVSFYGNQVAKTLDTGRGIAGNLGNSASNLVNDAGDSVRTLSEGVADALPYLAAAGVALGGIYMLSGNKRSQFSRSIEGSTKRTKYSYGL